MFDFKEFIDSIFGPLAPQTRLLDAAERRFRRRYDPFIDANDVGVNGTRHAPDLPDIENDPAEI